MIDRRDFIKSLGITAAMTRFGIIPKSVLDVRAAEVIRSESVAEATFEGPQPLIPASWIDQAIERWNKKVEQYGYDYLSEVTRITGVGVDVAFTGRDRHTVAVVHDLWFARVVSYADDHSLAMGLGLYGLDRPSRPTVPYINVSSIGIGAMIADYMSECYDGTSTSVHSVNGYSGCGPMYVTNAAERFSTARCLMYWKLREALDPANGVSLCLPPDPHLAEELRAISWRKVNGVIHLNSADEVRMLLQRAPYRAAAVALCWLGYDESWMKGLPKFFAATVTDWRLDGRKGTDLDYYRVSTRYTDKRGNEQTGYFWAYRVVLTQDDRMLYVQRPAPPILGSSVKMFRLPNGEVVVGADLPPAAMLSHLKSVPEFGWLSCHPIGSDERLQLIGGIGPAGFYQAKDVK